MRWRIFHKTRKRIRKWASLDTMCRTLFPPMYCMSTPSLSPKLGMMWILEIPSSLPCMQKCASEGLEKPKREKCLLKCYDWRRLCLNDQELVAFEQALEDCLVASKDPLVAHEECEHMAAMENCWPFKE